MRLFTAIRPSAAALAHLDVALAAVGLAPREGGGPPALRLVPPENRHITLAFHGHTPDGALEDLLGALGRHLPPALERAQVRAHSRAGHREDEPGDESAPHVSLAGAGVFAGRTLWVGVDDAGLLAALARASVEAADEMGVPVDADRPRFRAHLTVARVSARAEHRAHRERRRRDGGHGHRRSQEAEGVRSGGRGRLDQGSRGEPVALTPADAAAHALAVYRGPRFAVTEALVIASELGRGDGGAPLYETVGRVPLSA